MIHQHPHRCTDFKRAATQRLSSQRIYFTRCYLIALPVVGNISPASLSYSAPSNFLRYNLSAPLFTVPSRHQSITAGVIFPAADATAQLFSEETEDGGFDFSRTLRWLFFGFVVQAPWNHVSVERADRPHPASSFCSAICCLKMVVVTAVSLDACAHFGVCDEACVA